MSHEFYQIMVGSPTISLHSWKQLALWSIEYSCLDEADKDRAVAIFTREWERFCVAVVDGFGHLVKEADVDEHGDEVVVKEEGGFGAESKVGKGMLRRARVIDKKSAAELYT